MLRRVTALTTSAGIMGGQSRGIRTQIPPRPLVTVVAYLDRAGNPIRNRVETELALIKTRDNKYWLQRVLPDGSNVRWRVPGLDKMKNATSFETFSMHDIDEGGGVQLPHEVMPWSKNSTPEYNDSINIIHKVNAIGKLTRKDRRYWNRELYSQINEHEEKYSSYWKGRILVGGIVSVYLVQRAIAAYVNNRNFLDSDVYTPRERGEEDYYTRFLAFGDKHPEHATRDARQYMASPGQMKLGVSRHDLHGENVHTPDLDNMLVWQIQHLMNYNHWPKPIDE